jgi:hypothetical protein
MRRLAWLLLVAILTGCAENGLRIKFEPLDQDPGARAGSRGGTMIGHGPPKGD